MNCNIASLLMGDPKAFFSSDLVSGSRRDNVSMVRALIAYLYTATKIMPHKFMAKR
jgi:hypothetical protein